MEKTDTLSGQLKDLWEKLVTVQHSLDSCDSSVQDARKIIDGSLNDTADIRNSLRVAGDKLNQVCGLFTENCVSCFHYGKLGLIEIVWNVPLPTIVTKDARSDASHNSHLVKSFGSVIQLAEIAQPAL